MLLAFTSIIACSLAARGQLQPIRTEAVCQSDFAWASNSQNQSPCLVAANVNALCNSNTWDVPALSAGSDYSPPNTTSGTANPCTCSWASYNLMSACAVCQGFANQTSSWTPYTFHCTGQLSDSYFPTNLTLPAIIPVWAITNPKTWPNGLFNSTVAKTLASEGHANVGSPSPPSKSTPIGAIVGGVVGGVVVLLIAVLVGIYLVRRASRHKNNDEASSMLMVNNTHLRSHSDVTGSYPSGNSNSRSTPLGYTSLSSTPVRPPTSPTIRTHGTSSIRSFPFFSSAGSTVPSPPSVRPQSPPPASVHQSETAVEPFVLPPSNIPNPDRKQANGAYPVYDSPTAPPPKARMDVRPTTPTQGGRTRYNPPAYTEQTKTSPEAGGSPSSRRRPPPSVGQGHSKKGSADTQHSFTSSRSGGGGGATRAGGSNMSAIANVVNPSAPVRTAINQQSNPHNVIANANFNAIPTGHGRQLSGNTSNTSLAGKRRPTDTDDSFSARDIA